eukprot:SAG31_NODE_11619_length_1012_cov_2.542169_1_plen_88_part_00
MYVESSLRYELVRTLNLVRTGKHVLKFSSTVPPAARHSFVHRHCLVAGIGMLRSYRVRLSAVCTFRCYDATAHHLNLAMLASLHFFF